jgi:hypothetical protein
MAVSYSRRELAAGTLAVLQVVQVEAYQIQAVPTQGELVVCLGGHPMPGEVIRHL